MRVFVAGAGGAVGRRLVPMLVARGHQVTGTTSRAGVGGADPTTRRGAGRRRRPRRRRHRPGRGPSRAGRDHPPDDGPLGHARLQALRPLVRTDEPAPDGGHGAPPGGRQGQRRQAVRRPELHRLEQQPRGLVDQDGGRPARSAPGQGADARRSPRSGSSSAPCSRRRSKASSSATAVSTARARRRRWSRS